MKLFKFLEERPGLIQELKECKNEKEVQKTLSEIVTTKDAKVLELDLSGNLNIEQLQQISGGKAAINEITEIGALLEGDIENFNFAKSSYLAKKRVSKKERMKDFITGSNIYEAFA